MPRNRRDRVPRIEVISVGIAATAFLAGLVAAFVASPVDGLVVGLLTEIVLETLNASYKEREYELRLAALAPVPRGPDFVSKLADVGAFMQTSPQAELLRNELQLRLAEFEAHLDHLGRGRVVRDGLDVTDLLLHTTSCEKDLRATTTVRAATVGTPDSWWQSRGGQDYWESNKAAIARGVHVTRVFIIDEATDAVVQMMEQQRLAGVEVFYVPQESVPHNLRTNVIVWDGGIAWRAQMGTTGHISENRFYTRPDDVHQLEQVYMASRIRATAYVPSDFGPSVTSLQSVPSVDEPAAALGAAPSDS